MLHITSKRIAGFRVRGRKRTEQERGFAARVVKHKLVLTSLAALVAVSVSFPAEAAKREGRVFLPGTALGGARIGMTKAQVLGVWGKRHGVCRDCARTTWYFNDRPFEPQGTGVVFRRGRAAHLFTVWRPEGWRTPDGLVLGAAESAVHDAYPSLTERECERYSALVMAGERAQTVFYVYRDKLWGFGLTRPGADPCL